MTTRINFPLCACVLILASCNASASTYYVSNSTGDDMRSPTQAQNPNTPWKTIQKAASTMGSGDICSIRAGTYRETVTPNTGQSFTNHEGEYVLISGCDVVSSGAWTRHGEDIYKAEVATKVYDVFVDGSYMDKAQYPSSNGDRNSQAAWAPTVASFVSRTATRIAFDDEMNFPDGFWDGGWYQGLNGENCYSGTCGNITSSSGGALTLGDVEFRQEFDNPAHFGTGKGYIINHLNCLDTPKEWHWENDTLYLYPPGGESPSGNSVEARVRIHGFDVDVDNVTIKGLNFKGAAVRLAGNECTVEGCTFRYVSPWGNHKYPGQGTAAGYYNFGGTIDGTSGIHISGTKTTFQGNYVAHGWGALVSCRGSNNWIDNNVINDANWATRQNTVNIQVSGALQKITRNTLRTSNAMLICISDMEDNQIFKTSVRNNDCRYWGYLNPDGGTAAIYRNGSNDSRGDVYAYNIIAFGMGEQGAKGIYLDDGSQNLTVHHNVIYLNNHGKIVRGIWFHGNFVAQSNIAAYNNTCFGLHGTEWNQAVAAYNREGSYTNVSFKNNLSDTDAFVNGTTMHANSGAATPSYFVDVAKVNFRLTQSATEAIDQGVEIRGITDGYAGSKPDVGAHEWNGKDWQVGSTVAAP